MTSSEDMEDYDRIKRWWNTSSVFRTQEHHSKLVSRGIFFSASWTWSTASRNLLREWYSATSLMLRETSSGLARSSAWVTLKSSFQPPSALYSCNFSYYTWRQQINIFFSTSVFSTTTLPDRLLTSATQTTDLMKLLQHLRNEVTGEKPSVCLL